MGGEATMTTISKHILRLYTHTHIHTRFVVILYEEAATRGRECVTKIIFNYICCGNLYSIHIHNITWHITSDEMESSSV